jgi:hypothetical protein
MMYGNIGSGDRMMIERAKVALRCLTATALLFAGLAGSDVTRADEASGFRRYLATHQLLDAYLGETVDSFYWAKTKTGFVPRLPDQAQISVAAMPAGGGVTARTATDLTQSVRRAVANSGKLMDIRPCLSSSLPTGATIAACPLIEVQLHAVSETTLLNFFARRDA